MAYGSRLRALRSNARRASSPSTGSRLSFLLVLVAGTGALLFGIGLATGMWFYLARLSPNVAAPAMDLKIAAWNILLFTAFALHHSVMARSRAKQRLMRLLPPRLERSIYVWVASLLFILVCFTWQPTRDIVWRAAPPVTWILIALQVSGLVVTALGARFLDIWDLAGVRQALATGAGSERIFPQGSGGESRPLDTITARGPFGLVRHPIYFGWLLLVWPAPLMTSGRLLFAAISTLYLVVAIPLEERSLIRHHGEQYRDYQHHVRSRLIPGVW
jgi:protein-S-isoprenylcysteine O-methyltransferase Ste14